MAEQSRRRARTEARKARTPSRISVRRLERFQVVLPVAVKDKLRDGVAKIWQTAAETWIPLCAPKAKVTKQGVELRLTVLAGDDADAKAKALYWAERVCEGRIRWTAELYEEAKVDAAS